MSIYITGTPYQASEPRGLQMNCLTEGCNGLVVRHSLGCGLSTHRCTRCFRRYEAAMSTAKRESSLSRALHEFLSWREED